SICLEKSLPLRNPHGQVPAAFKGDDAHRYLRKCSGTLDERDKRQGERELVHRILLATDTRPREPARCRALNHIGRRAEVAVQLARARRARTRSARRGGRVTSPAMMQSTNSGAATARS